LKSAEPIPQCGAICEVGDDIVLVSNKSGSRWVIPKGHFESTDTDEAMRAGQEAWEEAGVRGLVSESALGRFTYTKHSRLFSVAVYRIEQCQLSDTWPESHLRKRILVSPAAALELVREAGLRELIRSRIGRFPLA